MKKLVCLTISSVLAFLSIPAGLAASADTSFAPTVYPSDRFAETISFTSLTDYAVGGEGFAFIDNGALVTVIDGDKKDDYGVSPTSVDYCDGVFCFSDADGVVYTLPGCEADGDKSITVFQNPLSVAGGEYKLLGGNIYFCATDSVDYVKVEANCTFSVLKTYGGKVYAIGNDLTAHKDGLYIVEQTSASLIEEELIFVNYAAAREISKGTAADASDANSIYNLNSESLHFVELIEGSFMTGVSLSDNLLTDTTRQFFDVNESVGTFKVGEPGRPAEGDVALLLSITGDSYLVAIGNSVYIMPSSGATITDVSGVTAPQTNLKGSIVLPSCYVYYSPFLSVNTEQYGLSAGDVVTVLETVALPGVLEYNLFYRVEYKDADGISRTGYVPDGYISAYIYSDDDPVQIDDPDYSSDDYISTVVLILIIIALVLIAIGYIVYVLTSDNKKKSSEKIVKSEKSDDD